MALKLSKPMRDGGAAEYWRLAPVVHYDIQMKAVTCHFMLYINEAARRAGKLPVPVPNLEASVADVPATELKGQAAVDAIATGDPRGAIYEMLKNHPFFEGSEDVLEDPNI